MIEKSINEEKIAILVEFAKRVRQRRYLLEITQEQLAEDAQMHVNYLGSIERAKRNPSLICIISLARALKISPKDLIPD